MINASKLLNEFSDLIDSSAIDSSLSIDSISPIDNYTKNNLVVCADKDYADALNTKQPALVICTQQVAELLSNDIAIATTKNPRLAQALIKQAINDYDASDSEWDTMHSSAIIHPSANIGKNCRIGPKVIIGENVTIGDSCIIRNSCVIEKNVSLGNNCVIHSLVNIGYDSKIGNNVIIRPGAILGNEGFGLAPDSNKQFHRLPHTGSVIIEDDVIIGSSCNIDRGTYGATTIKRGSKLDALCHIAHNVTIGEDCIITAQCVIAGSSNIGDRVIMSGQTGVLDHINICPDVTLVHRAAVIEDIKEKGMWAGSPAKPFKSYVRNLGVEKRLEKKISALEERLQELEQKL